MRLNNHGVGSKELLTVIIIICMMIVMLVPTILNVIEFADRKVLLNNVIAFRREVDKSILFYINGGKEISDGCYYITRSGDVCLGDYDSDTDNCYAEPLVIEMEGVKPNSGAIDISAYKISDLHNISIENFFVNLNSSMEYYISEDPQAQMFCRK